VVPTALIASILNLNVFEVSEGVKTVTTWDLSAGRKLIYAASISEKDPPAPSSMKRL